MKLTSVNPSGPEIDALVAATQQSDNLALAHLARRFSQTYPTSGFGWAALGIACMRQGKYDGAIEPLQIAARLLPTDSAHTLNLGISLQKLGRFTESEAAYRDGLKRNPDCWVTMVNLGGLLVDLGRHVEAEPLLRNALRLQPASAAAMQNLGIALQGQGRAAEAVVALDEAASREPRNLSVLQRLAGLLYSLNRVPEAVKVWAHALRIEPDNVDILCELGGALVEKGDPAQVEGVLFRALQARPDEGRALRHLGRLRFNQGRFEEAREAYAAAGRSAPDVLEYALLEHLLLPTVLESSAHAETLRARRREGLLHLRKFEAGLPRELSNPLSFYLAYHDADNRDLMQLQGEILKHLMPGASYDAPHLSRWGRPNGGKIRIGFLSQYFTGHTIGKLYAGYIRHLDRSRFEVIVFHTLNADRDARRVELSSFADKSIDLPLGLAATHAAISSERLDVLFYPDIGMSPTTYYLAFARLAPVQVVSWGHPDTTGLDTLDYFVSAASIEPPGADAAYTERLVRLQRLPCFYPTPTLPEARMSRAQLGLPGTGVIYACPQSLYKIHPEFDQVLADIAEGDPDGHIVMIEGHPASLTGLLRQRWARAAPILLDRVKWLPRLDFAAFISLLDHTDVLLDPIHFGSGNTLYEGMALGVPVVTWRGRFARGRIVAGAYQQMGIADAPIAERIEDYAPLALALGRDPGRRASLRQALRDAAARELFGDVRAVRELEDFFEAAVASASRREKLPADWQTPTPR